VTKSRLDNLTNQWRFRQVATCTIMSVHIQDWRPYLNDIQALNIYNISRTPNWRVPAFYTVMPSRNTKQCPCLADAESIKALVFSMNHVSFEAILPACGEIFRLADSTKTCPSCVVRESDTLLAICHQMILLLKAAVYAHTPLPARAALESSLGAINIICIPSPMFMGIMELNGRQSTALAYDLIARRLRQIVAVLGQMNHSGASHIAASASHLHGAVMALLEKLHAPPG
jgi:hypothetical protein